MMKHIWWLNKLKKGLKRCFKTENASTFKNSDGSRRQKVLKKVKRGEVLNLRHQPIKGYPNAIAVSRKNGKQIGNILEKLAKDVYQYISGGAKVKCKVLQVTGGTRKAPTRGCNIEINIKQ